MPSSYWHDNGGVHKAPLLGTDCLKASILLGASLGTPPMWNKSDNQPLGKEAEVLEEHQKRLAEIEYLQQQLCQHLNTDSTRWVPFLPFNTSLHLHIYTSIPTLRSFALFIPSFHFHA